MKRGKRREIHTKEAIVKINEIRAIAEKMSLSPGKMKKEALIRAIQEKEGYTPCFKQGRYPCDQYDCCWRTDCKPVEKIEGLLGKLVS
jgi:hypothetical protein